MRGVIERAVSAVIDVKFIAASPLNPHDEGAIFRAQGPAGFAPKFRRITDRQILKRPVDGIEKRLQPRWLHARIDTREAAADVNNVNGDARFHDSRADALHCLRKGMGRHCLATDMETDTQRVSDLPRLDQQILHLVRGRAEFGRKAQHAMFGRHADAHAQGQVGRALGCADDLGELFLGIERECTDAVGEIGFADRLFGLDRMHEAQGRLWQQVAHQSHFGDGSGIIMRDAAIPQQPDQIGRGIGFYRIERLARKLLDKEAGGARGGMRTEQCDRLNRKHLCDIGTASSAGGGGS